MKFIARWLVTAIAAIVAVNLVPGITAFGSGEAWLSIAAFALYLSLVNIVVKPIFQVLGLPITVLTLGIFYLVINTIMIYLAANLSATFFGAGIVIGSFGSAFIASIIISLVSAVLNSLLSD